MLPMPDLDTIDNPSELVYGWLLPSYGMSKADLAKKFGYPVQMLYDVTNRNLHIGPRHALMLEAMTGLKAETWIELKHRYIHRERLGADLDRVAKTRQLARVA